MQPARTGAGAIQRHDASNPRELVNRLYESDPTASREALFDKFRRQLDADAQRAVDWYFFVNMYEYAATSRNRKEPRGRAAAEQARAARTAAVHQIKERIVRAVLLDHMLPDGTRLRDATFGACQKAGGWLARVSKQGTPDQIVGEVLTETQLWELHDA